MRTATGRALYPPGPWYSSTSAGGNQGLIYEEGTGKTVAVSYDPKDADLIAAAPDLLEACEAVLERGDFDKSLRAEERSLLRAAIAKARGGAS